MKNIEIIATGKYLPTTKIDNTYLAKQIKYNRRFYIQKNRNTNKTLFKRRKHRTISNKMYRKFNRKKLTNKSAKY